MAIPGPLVAPRRGRALFARALGSLGEWVLVLNKKT